MASAGTHPGLGHASIRAATCDLARMGEIEREVDHDMIAFLRATGESVGDAARFIHLGLTSSDVVDTGLAIQARTRRILLRHRPADRRQSAGERTSIATR